MNFNRFSWTMKTAAEKFCTQIAWRTSCSVSLGQYRTKIVRQMRRQIFRQMKQKAEWILDVFTSIFVKYESLFRIWRMQIASSDFLRDEGKNGENPLWIFEYFPEISRKICTQDACGKIRNRLWREICKQMACKVARRSLCGIALGQYNKKFYLFADFSSNCTDMPFHTQKYRRNFYAICWKIWQSIFCTSFL